MKWINCLIVGDNVTFEYNCSSNLFDYWKYHFVIFLVLMCSVHSQGYFCEVMVMAFLSKLVDSYKIESSNYRYYNAKSSSYHLKRSDVWFGAILSVTTMFFSATSLFCAINISLLLGALTFLLGSSFSCLLFLLKLLVTGELDDGYSKSKQYFQEEIDYKISAEICKSKSKIYMIALSTLNRLFGDEGCVVSNALSKGELKCGRDKLIDSEVNEFRNNYSQYPLEKLNTELNFLERRLEMLYKQLEVDGCRKVMYKELKIRLNDSEGKSASFRPKDPDNAEIFRQLIFYLPNKYGVGVDIFKGHYPLDSLEVASRVNSIIREIAILEIRKVLVVHELSENAEGFRSSAPVTFSPIAPTCEMGMTTTEELTPTGRLGATSCKYSKTLKI